MELMRIKSRSGGAEVSVVPSSIGTPGQPSPAMDEDLLEIACLPLSTLSADPTVRLTVDLKVATNPVQPVVVEAVPRAATSGTVLRAEVQPADWVNGQTSVTVDIDAAALVAAGVAEHRLSWEWHFGTGNLGNMTRFGVSAHRFFVTLGPPTDPWTPSPGNVGTLATPFTSALATACDWARGARSARDVAGSITRKICALGDPLAAPITLRYEGVVGRYLENPGAMPTLFRCEQFLSDLRTFGGSPLGLNCIESTAVVVSLANVLGCSLTPVIVDAPKCSAFKLNRVRPLGHLDDADVPEFHNHLIAAERGAASDLSDALVFDPVVLVNPGPDPTQLPITWHVVAAMRLGTTAGAPGQGEYLPQLIETADLAGCSLTVTEPARVIAPNRHETFNSCTMQRNERFRAILPPAVDDAAPDAHLFIGPIFDGFSMARGETVTGIPGMPHLPRVAPRTSFIYRSTTTDLAQALTVDVWEAATADDARSVMAKLLAGSELPLAPVKTTRGVAYAAPGRQTMFWWTGRSVTRVSNAGRTPVDVTRLLPGLQPR